MTAEPDCPAWGRHEHMHACALGVTPEQSAVSHENFLAWLTALSTAVGVAAAIAAGVFAALAYLRERARDEQRAEDDRRSQAVLVSAWAEFGVARADRLGENVIPMSATASVRNGSSDPIYGLMLWWSYADRFLVGQPIYLVPPETTLTLDPPEEVRAARELRRVTARNSPAVLGQAIGFVDRREQAWIRDRMGKLKEVSAIDFNARDTVHEALNTHLMLPRTDA